MTSTEPRTPRLVGPLALIGALVLCSACTQAVDGSSTKVPGVRFSADVTVSSTAVEVRYEVRNAASRPVLVIDKVASPSGTSHPLSSEAAYVRDAGGGLAEISRRVFEQPEGKDFAQLPSVGWTQVAEGRRISGTLSVPRPLTGSTPFGEDRLSGDPDEVEFCLGVLDPEKLFPKGTPSGATATAQTGDALKAQQVFCSERVRLG